jgi:hypothetical protein
MRTLIVVTALLLVAVVTRVTAGFEAAMPAPVAPPRLSETGLYAGEGTTRVDPRNRPFSPQYPLWTDGAAKRRWIRLPEGSAIDATNLSRWEFPIGTKIWKEFSYDGHKVETRLLWRVSTEQWVFASYAWNQQQTEATLAPEGGIADIAEVAPGKFHSIPAITDCQACHTSSRTEVLGFDALQLSDDRDPNAPHAEPLTREMITLRTLTEENLIVPKRTGLVTTPPRIEATTPEGRAALGYLSANCGHCHNRESSIASLGLILKHSLPGSGIREPGSNTGSNACTAALSTTVGQRGHWVVPEAQEESRIINPGKPESSALIRRVKSRRPLSQMPPVGSVLVDRTAVDLLTSWVRSNPAAWQATMARCAASGS